MRFTLGFLSAVILANIVNAVPAANPQVNMGIESNEFKANQISQLDMKQDFEAFHWKLENEQNLVDRVFKFELSEPAELQVTDFMMGGDVFEVMDNGKSLGKTSELEMIPNAEPLYAATPEQALEDSRFSKAAYSLEAGAHEITIKVADSINENGTGALRVVQKSQSEKHAFDKRAVAFETVTVTRFVEAEENFFIYTTTTEDVTVFTVVTVTEIPGTDFTTVTDTTTTTTYDPDNVTTTTTNLDLVTESDITTTTATSISEIITTTTSVSTTVTTEPTISTTTETTTTTTSTQTTTTTTPTTSITTTVTTTTPFITTSTSVLASVSTTTTSAAVTDVIPAVSIIVIATTTTTTTTSIAPAP